MIHIVFNASEVNLIKNVIKLDEGLTGNVLQIKDDFAVGPLTGIETEEGWNSRGNWWRELLKNSPYENDPQTFFDDRETVKKIKEQLDTNAQEQVWIWMGQNQHDVCGYYWFIQHFKEYQGKVQVIYLNNLPFINEKGNIFYPNWISEIPAKEFLKAKKLAREITLSEFEVDPDEWTKICNENKGVRLLEGGKKLTQADYDFYDAELKKQVTGDWQKASKIIHHFLSKAKHTTGDAYLLWRLKIMIAQDMFDVQGKVGNMKDFEVKLKA